MLSKETAGYFEEMKDFTSLHWAAYNGQAESIGSLVAEGIDVNALDGDGKTPLMWAVLRGHATVAHFLLKHGAKIDAVDYHGLNSLALAVMNTHLPSIRVLMKSGADPVSKGPSGLSAMDFALDHGDAEIIDVLNEFNAKTGTVNTDVDDMVTMSELQKYTQGLVHQSQVSVSMIENPAKKVRMAELAYIKSKPALYEYYVKFVSVYQETYIAAMAIHSGFVDNARTATYDGYIDAAVGIFGGIAKAFEFSTEGIPLASQIAKTVTFAAKSMNSVIQNNKVKRLVSMNLHGEKLFEETDRLARWFTLALEAQILKLEPKTANAFITWCKSCKDWLILNDVDTPAKAEGLRHISVFLTCRMKQGEAFHDFYSEKLLKGFNSDFNLDEFTAKRDRILREFEAGMAALVPPAVHGPFTYLTMGVMPKVGDDKAEELEKDLHKHDEELKKIQRDLRAIRDKITKPVSAGAGLVFASAFSNDTTDGKAALDALSIAREKITQLQKEGVRIDDSIIELAAVTSELLDADTRRKQEETFKTSLFDFEAAVNIIKEIANVCHGKGNHNLARHPKWGRKISIANELKGSAKKAPSQVNGAAILQVLAKHHLDTLYTVSKLDQRLLAIALDGMPTTACGCM